jgi:hypothetical protein
VRANDPSSATAAVGAIALVAATAAAFLAYLSPELLVHFANSFFLCS